MIELENILESLYFSASRPISTSEVLKILDDPNYDLKAIKEAILNAEPNESIIIAGKGHENYQDYGNKIISISDKQIVKNLKFNHKLYNDCVS